MADIRVAPDELRHTHHISLSDGTTEVGLVLCDARGNPDARMMRPSSTPQTPMQVSSGDSDYGSYELPYTPLTQKSWEGGRGQEDFEDDKTRYADSFSVDTSHGDIILGPRVVMGNYYDTPETLTRSQTGTWKHSNPLTVGASTDTLTFGSKTNAVVNGVLRGSRFQWTSDYNLEKITVYLAKTNRVRITLTKTPSTMSTVYADRFAYNSAILNGGGSSNGLSLVSKQWFAIEYSDTLQAYTFDMPSGMEKNAYYILGVMSVDNILPPQTDPFDIPPLFGINTAYSTTYECVDVSGSFYINGSLANFSWWDNTDGITGGLAFVLHAAINVPGSAHFFDYRGTKFLVTTPSSGSAPRLMYEGFHGYVSDDPTWESDKLKISGLGSECVGAKAKIIAGAGSNELTRWRKIVSVAATYAQCSPVWNIDQDTTTEVAIVGTGKWKEITGHGITKAVTSVCVVNDIVYFALGEGTAIRRMRMVNTSGVWTAQFADEPSGNDATHLEVIQNESGVKKIWRSRATAATVASSDVKTWGNNLDFGSTNITCGNNMYRITGIEPYGDPRIPWIMKEDGFGAISNDIYDQVPIKEFATVADDDNGRAHLQRDVYLYINLLNGLERYYNDRLDDIGPNRDLGLPNERAGKISHLMAYPGKLYACIDHPNGYSSVMLYNDFGWHEIYRTQLNARLYTMSVQVIPGEEFDRLWLAMDGSYAYLPIAIDPKKQTDYQYNNSGELITSWIYGGYRETKKFFRSVKLFMEDVEAGHQYARVSYQVDYDDGTWIEIPYNFETSPDHEELFSPDYDVSGKRIRLKISLYSDDSIKTPRVKAYTIDTITRVKMSKTFSFNVIVDDSAVDLQSQREPLSAKELLDLFDRWSDSEQTPVPLTMRFFHLAYDDMKVFIVPSSMQLLEVQDSEKPSKIKAIMQIAMYKA